MASHCQMTSHTVKSVYACAVRSPLIGCHVTLMLYNFLLKYFIMVIYYKRQIQKFSSLSFLQCQRNLRSAFNVHSTCFVQSFNNKALLRKISETKRKKKDSPCYRNEHGSTFKKYSLSLLVQQKLVGYNNHY